MDFKNSELEILAEMLCGRLDNCHDLISDWEKLLNEATKKGDLDSASWYQREMTKLQKEIRPLYSIDEKLRPYYKK